MGRRVMVWVMRECVDGVEGAWWPVVAERTILSGALPPSARGAASPEVFSNQRRCRGRAQEEMLAGGWTSARLAGQVGGGREEG
ncbi:arginine/ornithine transport system ATPase [Salipiger bermudensis HTCC2601]|uniref:Arginine/ornithine transport system ATPase n=1 Tax=Salipiger bermudensis (strain DSM 26914 / JCM 13377 / KCTC 12554 / HTCC2601) TaxID=314265 RepID=Q0FQS3_SALBH|nr:arginine/ornithine transport system ATPase [Salipiger bermudensis HTCC2601]